MAIPKWVTALAEDEFQFIRRFILFSGSLKALAKEYDVSYPTLRLRLDRLIEKIQKIEDPKNTDPFRLKIQLLAIEGALDFQTAKIILAEYDKQSKKAVKQ